MLHYLLDVIINNLIVIIILALFLVCMSIYSSKVKKSLMGLIVLGIIYIICLRLYKYGIGNAFLYNIANRYVIVLCGCLDRITETLFANGYYFSKIIGLIYAHNLNEIISFVFITIQIVLLLYCIFNSGKKKIIASGKIIVSNAVIIQEDFNNNNIVVQPLFLLNDVFRC